MVNTQNYANTNNWNIFTKTELITANSLDNLDRNIRLLDCNK